ncbi:hypothetical protein GCM10020367_27780 [Streptomyces sannanensis]|uniref:Tyr recombinase domain-containing protein n=1 Tax=Streptomyces sannanensis TaxID=285536 RepID=A0ABP6SB53_9ACTN
MLFEVELSLEGLVDRLDDLPQRLEQGSAGPPGCATLLTAAGVAPRVIMEILGHSQIGITMDVYTHVVHDTQREAISHMGRLLDCRQMLPSKRPEP